MKRKLIVSTFLVFLLLPFVSVTAYAVCPVCTVAVLGGLGLSRWLGIDDTISGVWIGGLILSLSFWLSDWAQKRNISKAWPVSQLKIPHLTLIAIFITYLLVFVPLQMAGITGHPFNKLWGIDKLFLGAISGSLVFLIGVAADKTQRRLKGKQFFSFQKVIFPVLALVIMSIIFAVITKR